MATDIKKIMENLLCFYDFKDRSIISVGAGGGQLIEYGRTAKKVFALDNDPQALKQLKANLKNSNLEKKFESILCDFNDINLKGDTVLFEFCLHEMPDPISALTHAQMMASDILIFDHAPGSEWAYITAEDEKVISSWLALKSYHLRKKQFYDTVQFFKDYEELYQKVKAQGERSIARIQKYRSKENFSIPMRYGLALI